MPAAVDGQVFCRRCRVGHSFEDLILADTGDSERRLEQRIRRLRIMYWSPRINRVTHAPRWVMSALWWIWHCQLYPIQRESGPWNFTGYATGSVGSHYDATFRGVPGILAQVAQSIHVDVARVRLPHHASELQRLYRAIESLRGTHNINLMNMWVSGVEPGQLVMLDMNYRPIEHSPTDLASCWVIVEPPPAK